MTTPAATPATAGDPILAQTRPAIEQIRSTAKWIATAAAGAISLLLAGVQLTSLGTLPARYFWLACLGVALTLAGAAGAIFALARVMSPVIAMRDEVLTSARAKRSTMARFLTNHPAFLLKRPTSAAFADDADTALSKAEATRTDDQKALVGRVDFLVPFSHYFRVYDAYRVALRVVAGAAAVATTGIVLFVWAKDQSPAPSDAATVTPVNTAVTLFLTADGSARLASELGAGCVATARSTGVPAVATASDTDSVTVVIVPTGSCTTPATVVVPLDDGYARPTASVTPPTPSPSAT